MPPREPRVWTLRIEDILRSISRIQRYTAGMTYETFRADEKTVDAVARNFTIIGEAARHVPTDVQARYHNSRGTKCVAFATWRPTSTFV